jgi:hypothetical protein
VYGKAFVGVVIIVTILLVLLLPFPVFHQLYVVVYKKKSGKRMGVPT